MKRAKEAAFDERLALLGLMLDGVSGLAAKALEREAVLMDVRDVLRAAKECIISGASAKDELAAAIAEREERLEKRQKADTATAIDLRVARLAVAMLKGFVAHCDLQQSVQGAAAFEVVQADFKAEVETLQPLVDRASAAIDNAFSFIDQAFGADREQLVFVTELTARRATARFINRFGSDSYYAHNDELMVDARRDDLLSEIDKLEL